MTDARSELIQLVAGHRRTTDNPISSISFRKLGRQLADFKMGALRDFALTAEAIEERDDVLAGVIPKAKAAVARHGFEVCVLERIPAGMEKDAERQKEALEHFYNNLRATSAMEPDELGGFSLLVRQIMDAKAKRYSCHHIVWKPDRTGGLYSAEFIHVPLWFFENRTGPMRFVRSAFGYGLDGEAMDPGAWLVSVGDGLMRACAAVWAFKRAGIHAWVNYCEKHGFPMILGKTAAAKGTADWDAMVEAVRSVGEDFSAVVNESAKIELVKAEGAGQIPHPPLVERMDRALARLWRGNDLGTMSRDGQATGSNPQEGETNLLDLDAAVWVSETLQLKVDRLVLDYVFGEGTPALAYVKIKSAPKKETDLDLKVDEFLLRNGHPISKKQAAERYNRPLPPPEETELLKAPAPPPQGAPFGMPGAPMAGSQLDRALNEAVRAAATDAAFRAKSAREIIAAKVKAFAPLRARLEEIAGIEDEAAQDAALVKLKADLPSLAKSVGVTPEEVEAWVNAIGPKLVAGAVESAQSKGISA